MMPSGVIAIKAIQEQQITINTLNEKLDQQRKEMDAMRADMATLMNEMKSNTQAKHSKSK